LLKGNLSLLLVCFLSLLLLTVIYVFSLFYLWVLIGICRNSGQGGDCYLMTLFLDTLLYCTNKPHLFLSPISLRNSHLFCLLPFISSLTLSCTSSTVKPPTYRSSFNTFTLKNFIISQCQYSPIFFVNTSMYTNIIRTPQLVTQLITHPSQLRFLNTNYSGIFLSGSQVIPFNPILNPLMFILITLMTISSAPYIQDCSTEQRLCSNS